jgi:RNA polymerase sigma-B factor
MSASIARDRDPPHNGYEHLARLFAERAALPDGHPDRARLRHDLISGYLPVARNIARRYAHRGENPHDLAQVAALGLVLAVDRYDPARDVDFLSFAIPTIAGEVLRHFRDRASTIRLPRRLRQLHSSVAEAVAELSQRHGRAPRPSEIARELGVDVDVVLEGLASVGDGRAASLDESWARDGDGAAEQPRYAAVLARLEPEYDLIEHRESLAPLLAALPERERKILLMRFFAGKTQTEIAAAVGVSQMHVSRLLSRTLADLRRRLAVE